MTHQAHEVAQPQSTAMRRVWSVRPRLRRFVKDESGNATIEFCILFTSYFLMLFAGVEIAYINTRHALLERSLDIAVRDIRLATGHIPTYAEVRSQLCTETGIIDDCDGNLRLEMVQVDPRNFWTIEPNPDCINAEEAPRPVRSFEHGQDNELMLIRACVKYKPMIPTTGWFNDHLLDTQGYAQMIATSAFVQEPR